MDIGKKIKLLRDKKGLQQLELANKVGVSQSKMNKIETGYQKKIEPDILNDVAKALNVKVDYLLNDDQEEDDKQYIINKIANEFPNADLMFNDLANMTTEELEDVYDYIKFKQSKKDN